MLNTMGTTPLKACHGPEGGGAEETHVVLVANNKVPAQKKREKNQLGLEEKDLNTETREKTPSFLYIQG